MIKIVKYTIRSILNNNYEQDKIHYFIERYSNKLSSQILDVGCGDGRYLKSLTLKGYDVTGVEENEVLVSKNKSLGINCISAKEFTSSKNMYDIILMSHIVEHFDPNSLKIFLENYLGRLREGGILIIATPIINPRFYDDFDHIKPYSPIGIMMVFGGNKSQVQYYSDFKLNLVDLWFRSSFYRPSNYRARYFKSIYSNFWLILELLSAIFWRLSFGIIGFKSGWVGVFEKNK